MSRFQGFLPCPFFELHVLYVVCKAGRNKSIEIDHRKPNR